MLRTRRARRLCTKRWLEATKSWRICCASTAATNKLNRARVSDGGSLRGIARQQLLGQVGQNSVVIFVGNYPDAVVNASFPACRLRLDAQCLRQDWKVVVYPADDHSLPVKGRV